MNIIEKEIFSKFVEGLRENGNLSEKSIAEIERLLTGDKASTVDDFLRIFKSDTSRNESEKCKTNRDN